MGIGNTKTNTYKQNSADLRRKKKDKQANKTKAKKKKPREILNKGVVSLGSILEGTLTIQSVYLGARVGRSAASYDSLFCQDKVLFYEIT